MTVKTSTGLRNGMLVTDSFKGIMDGCVLKLYGGTVPADADAAIGGATLLCTITQDATATGLLFDTAAVAGVISKDPAQIWRGVNAASGTTTFYRLELVGDAGAASTTAPRVQGTVGTLGADLNLSSVALVASASQTIDFFSMALPTA